jgi:hypothetical protein
MHTLVVRKRGTEATFVVVHQLLTGGVDPLPVAQASGGIRIGPQGDCNVLLSPDLGAMVGETVAQPSQQLRVLTVKGDEQSEQVALDLAE